MRKSARLVQLLILIFILFGPAFASATLSTKVQRGEKLVQIPVAGRNAEICVVPKHLGNAAYSDHDLKDEVELCGIDQYTDAAVCPKINSTNPGLDLYSLPQGSTPAQVESAKCNKTDAKKIAK